MVTLGGLLFMNGVMLELANVDKSAVGGVINIDPNSPIAKLVNSNMSPALSWIVLVVGLALFAARVAVARRASAVAGPERSADRDHAAHGRRHRDRRHRRRRHLQPQPRRARRRCRAFPGSCRS